MQGIHPARLCVPPPQAGRSAEARRKIQNVLMMRDGDKSRRAECASAAYVRGVPSPF
jgi:hypothetical protein